MDSKQIILCLRMHFFCFLFSLFSCMIAKKKQLYLLLTTKEETKKSFFLSACVCLLRWLPSHNLHNLWLFWLFRSFWFITSFFFRWSLLFGWWVTRGFSLFFLFIAIFSRLVVVAIVAVVAGIILTFRRWWSCLFGSILILSSRIFLGCFFGFSSCLCSLLCTKML